MSRSKSILSLLLISIAVTTPSQSQAQGGIFRTIFGTTALVAAMLTNNKSEQAIMPLVALACYTSIALDLNENSKNESYSVYKRASGLLALAAVTAYFCLGIMIHTRPHF